MDFYNHEPRVQSKLKPRRREKPEKKNERKKSRKSKSPSVEEEKLTNKKFAKFENLRPMSNFLISILSDYKVPHFKTKKIVGDIIERIVIAGYDWERIRNYQSKGEDHFNKKLIPYIFMSKDDLPQELSPEELLRKIFVNICDWNSQFKVETPRERKVNTRVSSEQDNDRSIRKILGKRKMLESNIDLIDDELSAKVNAFINGKDKRRRTSTLEEENSAKEERRSSSESSPEKPNTEAKSDGEKSPLASDSSSTDLEMFNGEFKEKQKQSLLEKVNEIIKSCVRLKTEKNITGIKLEKANKIIAKAEAKKIKLLNHPKEEDQGKRKEETELERKEEEEDCIEVNPAESDLRSEKDPEDIEEGEITDDDEEEEEVSVVSVRPSSVRKSSVCSELQAMAGKDNRQVRLSLDKRREARTHSRSPSLSPSHSYRKKAAVSGSRYSHHQYRQRSPSVSTESEVDEAELSRWIPITPCTIQEDVEVEPMSTVLVNIKAKGEFSFKDNLGCYVRITKWTGKDSVDFLTIKPQVIKIESSLVRVEMSNTYSDKFLNIYKHDKVACMSILSSPPPSAMLSRINCSPERYQSQDKRWFKVTTVVLHKKGEDFYLFLQSFISITRLA